MMVLVFPSHCSPWWSPVLLGMAEHLSAGNSEWIPCFVLLVCAAFALPIELSLVQLESFLSISLPIFPPIPLGQDELHGAGLWVELNHDSPSSCPRGAPRVQDNNRFDWNMQDLIYSCYCWLAINWQAPELAMGLASLTGYLSLVLVTAFCFDCVLSHCVAYYLTLLCLGTFW